MGGRFLVILASLMLLAQAVAGCSEPSRGRNFIQEGLDGDIVLALPDSTAMGSVEWEIKAATSKGRDMRKYFRLEEEAPFVFLATAEGIPLPKRSMRNMEIALEIACKANTTQEVYTVGARVISEALLDKVQVQVPENTTIGTLVYKPDARREWPKEVQPIMPQDESLDASRFFNINLKTGAISLDTQLDYESDTKLMKMIVVSKFAQGTQISILWLRVTNVNDNQPQMVLRPCPPEAICHAQSYVTEATDNGPLYIYNSSSIGAIDGDGDKITYSITKVKPAEAEGVCSIDQDSGEIAMEDIDKMPGLSRIYLTVQASDGDFFGTVSITIKINREGKNAQQDMPSPDQDDQGGSDLQASGKSVLDFGLPGLDLLDLPEWFLSSDDSDDSDSLDDKEDENEDKDHDDHDDDEFHLKNIGETVDRLTTLCSSSRLVQRLTPDEFATLVRSVDEIEIAEFCNAVGRNESAGNSTTALAAGISEDWMSTLAEIQALCQWMPARALPLFNVTEFVPEFVTGFVGQEADMTQVCQNSTMDALLDLFLGRKNDLDLGVSLASRLTWCFHTSLLFFLVTCVVTYFD